MSIDGHEQREANRIDREIQGHRDLELAEQIADEALELQALTRPELNVAAQIDKLGGSALAIKQQRDELVAVLKDIAMGAEIMLQPIMGATGDFERFAKEVRRVARAGLQQAAL